MAASTALCLVGGGEELHVVGKTMPLPLQSPTWYTASYEAAEGAWTRAAAEGGGAEAEELNRRSRGGREPRGYGNPDSELPSAAGAKGCLERPPGTKSGIRRRRDGWRRLGRCRCAVLGTEKSSWSCTLLSFLPHPFHPLCDADSAMTSPDAEAGELVVVLAVGGA